MGPFGSGKTTLLHALSGIIKLDAGSGNTVQWPDRSGGGESLSERERTSLRANSFGFVFQQGLMSGATAEGKRYPRRDDCRCIPRQQSAFHFADLLNRLGLGHAGPPLWVRYPVVRLQRVAIARSR